MNTSPLSKTFLCLENESHSVTSDSLPPLGLYSPLHYPSQNTGVGNLFLLQGIFPTQGSKPGLPHCRWILYQLSHKGSPRILKWVAYPFSRGSSQPRNWTRVSCIAGGFFTNWAIREVFHCLPGEGNGNSLQYSCLENSMDGGDWCARVHGVTESNTTERLHFLSFFLSFFVDSIFIITFHSNSFIYLYPLHPFIGWIFCNIKWKFTAISKANVCSSSSSTRRFHLNNYLHFSPSWITNGTIYTCTATLEQFKVFFSFFSPSGDLTILHLYTQSQQRFLSLYICFSIFYFNGWIATWVNHS